MKGEKKKVKNKKEMSFRYMFIPSGMINLLSGLLDL